ncbi:hypothetical protein SAMN02745975_00876 [Geosporobacter subterraneus DSM 17957]|uniref:Uncharacterized protein n=1 Tax=Geosporobacter subterraneus DSM 17957 TaxID=1121919 RepID=A0A1M6F1T9_9FIRM|nr:hypothetical protein [Geosporobacter subterraneus]SHI91606.1 hypothetical protein SAMN02745975_00876 [Geosporobacter subterraneus DSM 17957]
MELIFMPAIINSFFIFNLVYLFKKGFHKTQKLIFILLLMTALIFFTATLDALSVIGHWIGVYELPSEIGQITHIYYNKVPGKSSSLVINYNKIYEFDYRLVKNREFYQNRSYQVIYTPINKVVYRIIDLDRPIF